jgi:hypothetical protein
MSLLSRSALVALGLALICARHGIAQAADTSASARTSHSSMTTEQHAAMHGGKTSKPDSSFAALQRRGQMAMGVDQYASVHHFDVLPNGGRIALQMKSEDSLGTAQIRAHLKLIQHAFEAGDFSTPEFVHMRAMPGTAVMAQRRSSISYEYTDLPRGGELRIVTKDPEVLAAIAQFLAAQRTDHKVGSLSRQQKLIAILYN